MGGTIGVATTATTTDITTARTIIGTAVGLSVSVGTPDITATISRRARRSPLLKLPRGRVRVDYVARLIVNTNYSIT